jgi:hypothetical protein
MKCEKLDPSSELYWKGVEWVVMNKEEAVAFAYDEDVARKIADILGKEQSDEN